ncbi:MAG: membrane integrity-associated transporter subunit PqiC [Akkermansiaceae bacterium]
MKRYLAIWMPLVFGACTFLQPVEDDPVRHLLEAKAPSGGSSSGGLSVAVARPTLPPYLERVELVTRTEFGTLKVHENDLWSEPLDSAVGRVIADNLRRLKGSIDIQPSTNFISRDYSKLVEIRIERFDPLPDGNLVLECSWKVQTIGGGDANSQTYRTVVPIENLEQDPNEIYSGKRERIVAMNEALLRLSKKIARKL